MATYTVNKIDFSTVPSGTQTVSIDYKLWNATSWTNVSGSVAVNTNGTLVSPLPITGLTSGDTYNIRATQTCGSPAFFYIITVTAP